MIELAELDLPFLDSNDYSAVCSAVWYLRRGDPLDSACKNACNSKGVPAAKIKRIIKAALPAGYFAKRQRDSMKSMMGKTSAVFRHHQSSHMRSI